MLTPFRKWEKKSFVLAITASVAFLSMAIRNADAQQSTPPRSPSGAPVSTGSGAAATGVPAGTDPTAAAAQKTPTEILIGQAVPKGQADTPQYQDVTDAIIRFRNGDLANAEKLLRQARDKSQNKLPPVEIMVAKLFALAGQPAQARSTGAGSDCRCQGP